MKVSFVGAGRVGASAAFATMLEYMPDEITLIDVVPKLAEGQGLDLAHAAVGFDIPTKISGSKSLNAMKGSDVVVITAGRPRRPGMTRIQLIKQNAPIITSIAKKVRSLAKESVVVMVTNPVDPLTYLAWKETGFPRNRVFGVGNLVDTARLVSMGYDGIVIGQHGEYFTPIVSSKVFKNAIKDVKKVNENILKWKGGTEFGPAMEIAEAVGAVLDDLKSVMPVSTVLQGEYGVEDVSIGVPAIIGENGVEGILEIDLDKEQHSRFMKAVLAVDMALDSIGLKRSQLGGSQTSKSSTSPRKSRQAKARKSKKR